ncbi:MAG TPA: hypothetical protein VLC09_08780, partial [Polyangiaceae bacterium]|nr:hypothetical protein [Polyangiaceae bacterium]
VALVTLAVFLPGTARSATHGTSLPFKEYSAGHVTINLVTGELHTSGLPTPYSHMGLHTSESVGYAIPDGSGGFDVFANVTGTAANGDHLFGTLTNDLLVFTGGSGRFEGATGYLMTIWQQNTNILISGGILSIDFEQYSEGVLNLNRP